MKEVDKKTYGLIAEEIDSGNTQKALWTKAFSDAEGDESRTKALYINYRFIFARITICKRYGCN